MPALDMALLSRPQRLAAVDRARRVLADLPLPLDRIAEMACRLLDTPMGAVCLVAGDEILVGRHGLGPPLDTERTVPMRYSVGKYVVSANEPVVVEDMRTYPELRDHALAAEHGLRSWVGVPLHDTGDVTIGSVVVGDVRPRAWTERDVAVLRDIASVFEPVPGADGPLATLPEMENAVMLNMVAEAFVAVDVDGRIVGWNRAAEEMFGWTAGEAIGQRYDTLVLTEPVGEEFRERLERWTRAPAGRRGTERGTGRRRDGTQFPVEALAHTLRSPHGPIVCALLLDVSDLDAAARDADKQRRFLGGILESLQTMVAACDPAGNIVLANRTLRDFYRLPLDMPSMNLADWASAALHPDGRPMRPEETPLMRALGGEEVTGAEAIVTPPGGGPHLFLINARPVVARDGRRLGAVAALLDATEQRRIERFRACELEVVKALAYGGGIPEAGRAVVSATTSTLGWQHGELWLANDPERVLQRVASWSAPGRDHGPLSDPKLRYGEGLAGSVWADGEVRWLPDLAKGPPRLADAAARAGLRTGIGLPVRAAGGVVGVLTIFNDQFDEVSDSTMGMLSGLTAHLGAYLAQQRAAGLATELGRSRDDFISLVGHAVRTPLTSIASYTDLLLGGADSWAEQDREMLQTIHRQTDNLRAIVDDLLDLAGIESGHLRMEPRDLDLVDVVRAAVDGVRELARGNHVELTEDLPPAAPLRGDPRRLRLLLDNLLSNAVKYSPDGGCVLTRLRLLPDTVEVTIADQGVGVPVAERERLFQRFFRASNALDRGIQGTGLGLSIARAIAERHGGVIAFSAPPPGEPGTVLVVRLPRRGDAP